MVTEIKIGDTVRLKSGGPIMTVTDIGDPYSDSKDHAWCTWFPSEVQSRTEVFKIETIEIAKK